MPDDDPKAIKSEIHHMYLDDERVKCEALIVSYDETKNVWVCPVCKRHFPCAYRVKNRGAKCFNSHKVYGTKQLMALHAWSNFRKHAGACKRKGGTA